MDKLLGTSNYFVSIQYCIFKDKYSECITKQCEKMCLLYNGLNMDGYEKCIKSCPYPWGLIYSKSNSKNVKITENNID